MSSLARLDLWLAVGFLGQALFTARFAVQWVVSERKRDSVVPAAFWWLSLAGGSVLLIYVIHRRDAPLILGQAMGVFIYIRNLMLVAKGKRKAEKKRRRAALAAAQPVRVDPAQTGSMPQRSAGRSDDVAKGANDSQ